MSLVLPKSVTEDSRTQSPTLIVFCLESRLGVTCMSSTVSLFENSVTLNPNNSVILDRVRLTIPLVVVFMVSMLFLRFVHCDRIPDVSAVVF